MCDVLADQVKSEELRDETDISATALL